MGSAASSALTSFVKDMAVLHFPAHKAHLRLERHACALLHRLLHPVSYTHLYVAPRRRTDKTHGLDASSNHLVLLCKNETGYKNLMKIVSDAFVTGFYTRPRTDFSVLERCLLYTSRCV